MDTAESTTDATRIRLETERLRALVTNIRLGVLVEDEARRVAVVNNAFAELLGIPVEVMVGADCAAAAVELAPTVQDPDRFISRITELVASRESVIGDEIAFLDGRVLERDYVPIAVDSERRGHLWLFRDVTESRRLVQLERAAAVRDELRLVIDTIPGLVWSALPNGQVELFNQRWRDYTGLALEDVSGWGWEAVVWPEDLPALQASFSLGFSGARSAEAEARLRSADGQYRWFLFRAVPLSGKDGLPIRWYGQAIDIDDRKRSEEALQQAQMELSRVSRVTTLGELAASIAHEVNQPICAMVADASACLNLLSAPHPNFDDIRESLRAIVSDGARAGDVLARIKALLTRSAVEHQPCSLDHLIPCAVSLARAELGRQGVQVELSLGAPGFDVLGDPIELQQVLLNLLLNAGEAARELGIERRRVLVRSEVEDRNDQTWVTTSVRDFGIGIEQPELNRLFSAFYTTKQGGLGMGLSISRSIVERHGGRIWASRNADWGATFAFSLPAAQ